MDREVVCLPSRVIIFTELQHHFLIMYLLNFFQTAVLTDGTIFGKEFAEKII